MTENKVYSSVDIAACFFQKFEKNKMPFDKQKLQNLLFLAQMHYLLKNKKLLYPAFFVCDKHSLYEPSAAKIMQLGFPMFSSSILSEKDNTFLDLIWQKYGQISTSELNSLINNFCIFAEINNGSIINPLEIVPSFNELLQNNKNKSAKSKIMLSQNGPVRVTEWKPRKISTN